MTFLSSVAKEIFGLFVDDGSLALFSLILVALTTALAQFTTVDKMWVGVILVVGCALILATSVHRAGRRR